MFARKNILYCTKLLIILHSHLRKALSHAEIYSAKNKHFLPFFKYIYYKIPTESSVLGWCLSTSLIQYKKGIKQNQNKPMETTFLQVGAIIWPLFYILHFTVLLLIFVKWMHTVMETWYIKPLVLQSFSVPSWDIC